MKYINHMTSSHEDDKHEDAMALCGGGMKGLATYGLYWVIAEKIGAQIRPEQIVTWMTKPWRKWGETCGIRPTYFRNRVQSMAKANLIQLYCDDKTACINMPNILKYADEYTKSILRNSGETPESIARKFRVPAFLLPFKNKDLKTGPVETVDKSPISDGATAPGGVPEAPPGAAPIGGKQENTNNIPSIIKKLDLSEEKKTAVTRLFLQHQEQKISGGILSDALRSAGLNHLEIVRVAPIFILKSKEI